MPMLLRSLVPGAIAAAMILLQGQPASAQGLPAQIYAACRHPDAAAAEPDTPLWNLCNRIVIPPGVLAFRPATLQQIATMPLADTATIRRLAEEAETKTVLLPLLGGFLSNNVVTPEIQFEESSAALDTADQQLIAAVVPEAIAHLARHPDAKVVVTGYTSPGLERDSAVNRDIAEQRARVVAAELVKHGVSAQRMLLMSNTAPALGDVVTREEREVSRAATISVQAPAIAFSAGVARPRTTTLQAEVPGVQVTPGMVAATESGAGLSLSTLAVQATDVLVDRANVQLQVYVVREFGERLCPDNAMAERSSRMAGQFDLRTVGQHMRATCSLLHQGSMGFSPTGLGEVRLAVRRDLQALPQRLGFQALLDRKQQYASDPRYADAANVLLAALTFIDQVQNGADPLRAAAAFGQARLDGPGGISWALSPSDAGLPYTDGLRRFAEFATRVDTARRELSPYATDGWAAADTAFTYALRALAVQWDASGGTDGGVKWLAGEDFANLDMALAAYRDVNAGIERIRTLRVRADSLLTSGDAARSARLALYDEGIRVLSGMAPSLFLVGESQAQEVRAMVEPVRRVVSAVSTGRYGEAAVALIDVLGAPALGLERKWGPQIAQWQAQVDSLTTQAHELRTRLEAVPASAVALRATLTASVDSLARDSAGLQTNAKQALGFMRSAGLPTLDEQATVRVLSLVSGLVEARSDEQAGDALRAFVGQGGDFLSKRQSAGEWRVALNAYVGLGGGLEVLNDDPGVGKRAGGYGSIYLPIGVEFSRGCVGDASCGIFIPLVDLGAIAAMRFGGGDVEDSPDVEVARLFTPGVYAVLGFAGKPLSLGAGMTIAPDARERTDAATLDPEADRQVGVLRYGFFLAVDIPLFP